MSLIDIMVCACKQEATRQGPPGRTVRKGKEKKSSLDEKKNLSAHFMQTLPGLLNKVCEIVKWYSQLSLRRTPLGPALSVRLLRGVRLIESQIKGVKKGRDQL